jgi:hypothetical protein
MKLPVAMLAVALIVAAPPAAMAGGSQAPPATGHGKKHHRHHHPAPTPIPPIVVPPVVTPPVVTPEPTPPQVDALSFCVSTTEGWTYVQLTAGAMDPGTYWRSLYDGGAVAVVAGRYVMFVPKGDAGISLAKIVSGIGSTC